VTSIPRTSIRWAIASEESLSTGRLRGGAAARLGAEFPDVTSRSEKRALGELLSVGAGTSCASS
jgi:hypothetical protein